MKKSSITILFEDQNPDGYKLIEKSNWTGKAIYFPKNLLSELSSKPEFQKPGVYLLLGNDLDTEEIVAYVGEGDPVYDRINRHYSEKDFWTHCIFFCTKDESLNKAHIQHIESRLIGMAKDAKRCRLENGNSPKLPSLSEIEFSISSNFLEEMLMIYSVLGIKIFEMPVIKASSNKTQIFETKSGQADAKGYENSEGFVVLKGSASNLINTPSFPDHVNKIKERLIKDGVLTKNENQLIFTQDYQFNSPSFASSLVLGRPSNGRTDWRLKDGKTLKDVQDERIK